MYINIQPLHMSDRPNVQNYIPTTSRASLSPTTRTSKYFHTIHRHLQSTWNETEFRTRVNTEIERLHKKRPLSKKTQCRITSYTMTRRIIRAFKAQCLRRLQKFSWCRGRKNDTTPLSSPLSSLIGCNR